MYKKKVTKSALTLSMCLLILWALMGAGTSLAWFIDTTPVEKNSFDIGILDLEVSHKTENGYETIEGATDVFDDEALYEPGYVQVVRLKIENRGTIDFDYKMSVIPDLTTLVTALNVYNQEIFLPEHLKFGVVLADTEEKVEQAVSTRSDALKIATMDLSSYTTEQYSLEAGDCDYAAVVVCMPEEVGNEANYRDDHPPMVELGIHVKATQKGTPE